MEALLFKDDKGKFFQPRGPAQPPRDLHCCQAHGNEWNARTALKVTQEKHASKSHHQEGRRQVFHLQSRSGFFFCLHVTTNPGGLKYKTAGTHLLVERLVVLEEGFERLEHLDLGRDAGRRRRLPLHDRHP